MGQYIVRTAQLYHRYSKQWAIQDINISISHTGVLGLLGSNGAGKSTTMNILCGVLNQTSGKVYIDDIDLQEYPEKAKRLLGFLPQHAPLHLDLTVDEYLTYCAHIRDIPSKAVKSAVDAAKDKCGVTAFGKRLLSNLSGGYRQRVGIAQAIIHQPKLVVLDEPTNGLDPIQIKEVRHLIREIAEERAVIFSSHILSEVQATCNEIRMIEGGQIVFADTMEAFNNYILPNSMILNMSNPPMLEELSLIPGVTNVELLHDQRIRLHFSGPSSISQQIIEMSVAKSWQLNEVMLEKSSLDEIFAQLSNRNLK